MIPQSRHERAIRIQNPGKAARHSSAKVHPNPAENRNDSARHVLASMVSNAFNYGDCARVSHRKPLTSPPCSEQLSGSSTIQSHVAENNVLSAILRRKSTRFDHKLATREPLTDE